MASFLGSHLGVVGLVALVAGRAAGVFGNDDLRKVLGLGRILLMAAAAEVGDFGQLGYVGGGIVGVLRQRTMAGFAGDVGVFSRGARLAFVIVAHDAGLLAGVGDRMLANEVEGAGPVVAVLAESFGNDRAADYQEDHHGGEQDKGRPNQVSGIAEYAPHNTPPSRAGSCPPWQYSV